MHEFLHDVILHGLTDSLKILPFLFLTYLLMEFLEHKASLRLEWLIRRAGKFGPLLGGALGIIPQCGLSTVAANLYSARIVTVGTLMAVFLSTSDEMLPLLIGGDIPIVTTIAILGYKLAVGVLVGFLADFFLSKFKKREEASASADPCECGCSHAEHSILGSAIRHTLSIFLFLLLVTFVINAAVFFLGEDTIRSLLYDKPVISHLIAALIGLVPNCASSVLLTKFYLEGFLTAGAMFAGLLPGAGVGLLVLLRVNPKRRETLLIITALFLVGVLFGLLADLTPLSHLFAL